MSKKGRPPKKKKEPKAAIKSEDAPAPPEPAKLEAAPPSNPAEQKKSEEDTYKCAKCQVRLRKYQPTCQNCGITLEWAPILHKSG